jgi:ribosomal protein S18 acetylase RimI-like enzyme
MQKTYLELSGSDRIAHLADTVEQYFSVDTPLWWVEKLADDALLAAVSPLRSTIACLWLGTAIDQLSGDRHAHIFLLYVAPAYRRQGIGSALMQIAEDWAKKRGDRQIGLQVFQVNQAALSLYQQLGYEVRSLGMSKPL